MGSGAEIIRQVEDRLDTAIALLRAEVPVSELDIGCGSPPAAAPAEAFASAGDGVVDRCEALGFLAEHASEHVDLIRWLSPKFPTVLAEGLSPKERWLYEGLQGEVEEALLFAGDDPLSRAEAVFDLISRGLHFAFLELDTREGSAIDAYRDLRGDCTETTKLLMAGLAMAGLEPFAARVSLDLYGERVKHAVAGVEFPDGSTMLLDPTYGPVVGFGIGLSARRLGMREFWGMNEGWIGSARYARGDYEGAIEHYATAAALIPEEPDVHLNSGLALFKHSQQALDPAKKAEELRLAREAFARAELLEPAGRAREWLQYLDALPPR